MKYIDPNAGISSNRYVSKPKECRLRGDSPIKPMRAWPWHDLQVPILELDLGRKKRLVKMLTWKNQLRKNVFFVYVISWGQSIPDLVIVYNCIVPCFVVCFKNKALFNGLPKFVRTSSLQSVSERSEFKGPRVIPNTRRGGASPDYIYGCWTKNRGFYPPNHPFVHRVFHCKPSILGVLTPIFGSTPIFHQPEMKKFWGGFFSLTFVSYPRVRPD